MGRSAGDDDAARERARRARVLARLPWALKGPLATDARNAFDRSNAAHEMLVLALGVPYPERTQETSQRRRAAVIASRLYMKPSSSTSAGDLYLFCHAAVAALCLRSCQEPSSKAHFLNVRHNDNFLLNSHLHNLSFFMLHNFLFLFEIVHYRYLFLGFRVMFAVAV